MRTHACVLMCLLFAYLPSMYAQQSSDHRNALEQEIVAEEKEVWELNVREDWDTYAKLLSDDVLIVYSTGYSDKANVLKALLGMSEQHYLMEDVRVIPVGDAAGLVIYKVTQDWKERGKKMAAQYYVSSLWQKQDGKWLNRFWQETDTALPDGLRAAEQKEVENQIVALEKRLWNGDAADVSKLEADDYEAIKHAHRYHRADDEAAAKDVKFGLISMDDIQVRMLRPDVALLTYHATEKGSFRGINVPPSLYFGSIWVKQGLEWKNVFLEENLPDAFTESYIPAAYSDASLSVASGDGQRVDDQLSAQVLAKEKEIQEAQKNNDWEKFADLLSDDLVAIDEDGIHGRKELLDAIKAADIRFSDYKMEDVRVIPEGNGAIVAYKQTLAGTEHGKAFTWHIYTHSHWQRRGGKWLLTMFQDSMAKE